MSITIIQRTVLATLLAVSLLAGGCAHHPLDCALGIAWDDCLPGTAGYSNRYAELTRLDDLRKKGIITEAEFEAQKKKILNGTQAEAPPPVVEREVVQYPRSALPK